MILPALRQRAPLLMITCRRAEMLVCEGQDCTLGISETDRDSMERRHMRVKCCVLGACERVW